MSLSNYSELQSAVQDWLHIGGLSARVPDFIALAEADVQRRLFIRANEDSTTASLTSSLALPSDFVRAKRVAIEVGGKYRDIEYVPAENMSDIGPSGVPAFYTLQGDSLYTDPSPDGTYSIQLRYWKRFPALSNSSPTNWLLTNAPDVYLYGALAHSAPFVGQDSRVALWVQAYDRAIDQLISADKMDRYGPSLSVRLDTQPGNVRLA